MVFLVTLAFSSDPLVWFFLNASFGFFISLMGVSVNASAVMLQKQISINVMGRMHAGWSLGAVAAAIPARGRLRRRLPGLPRVPRAVRRQTAGPSLS